MKILVADDDPVSRRLLQGTLTRLGHDVVPVSDGTAAIECLARTDAPRMAILDWMMPGADGLAVCRAVRQRLGPYTYVILLTARDRRADVIEGLDAEADDFLTKPFDIVELRARLRSGERVLEVQERLLQAQEALRFEATHDRLTGLLNRGTILDCLERDLARARREQGPFGVFLADLDHFKRINDTHGHATGDAVLREAAQRMRCVLREYDALGRYGGEEFLGILPGADARSAVSVAQRAREAVSAALVDDGGRQVPATVSIGVSWSAVGADAPQALILAADEALYRAKAHGRNRVEGPDIPG